MQSAEFNNAWLEHPMQFTQYSDPYSVSKSNELIFTPIESRETVIIRSGDYRFVIPLWVLKPIEYFYENLILCGRTDYASGE
jgi:hypothetical protein